jgi:hypothetical protein
MGGAGEKAVIPGESVKKLILALCSMLVMAGCSGVDWFPALEVVTASAGGPYTLNALSPAFVILTGSGSSSKGTAVTYQWSVTSANSASATLGTPTTASTSFSATAAGSYTVQLKVTSTTDTTKSVAVTTTVTVTKATSTITAFADGPTKTGPISTPIPLNGSAITSPGVTPKYSWSVSAKPSTAGVPTFSNATSAKTTFTGDTVGDYTVKLTVSSATDASAVGTDTTVITLTALPATETVTVSAGAATYAETGIGSVNFISLRGTTNSTFGKPVKAAWSATGANASKAHFGNISSAATTFYADAADTYHVQLNGTSETNVTATPSTAVITVSDAALGTQQSYFPLLPVARTWTYSDGSTVTATGENSLTTQNQLLSTSTTRRIYDLPAAGGVLLLNVIAETTATYTPGLPIFPSNTTLGSAVPGNYTVTVGGTTPLSRSVTLTVSQLLDTYTVPGGATYTNVLHITANVNSAEGSLAPDSWYAPGVGLIQDTNKKLTDYKLQ